MEMLTKLVDWSIEQNHCGLRGMWKLSVLLTGDESLEVFGMYCTRVCYWWMTPNARCRALCEYNARSPGLAVFHLR
jgi:hypothetical protein